MAIFKAVYISTNSEIVTSDTATHIFYVQYNDGIPKSQSLGEATLVCLKIKSKSMFSFFFECGVE